MTVKSSTSAPRHAFTLLEVLVVVTLLAIMVAMTSLSLRQPVAAAKLGNAVERMAHYDALIRRWSSRYGRSGDLVIDVKSNTLTFEPSGESGDNYLAPLSASRGVNMEQVVIASTGREEPAASIHYSAFGTTPTFAVCLSSSAEMAEKRWLLFAGLTGQLTELKEESDVRAVLQLARHE